MSKGLTPWMAQMVDALLDYGRSIGLDARVADGFRTCAQQDSIYESGAGVATNARGCTSWHTWGRAVDLRIPGDRRADYAALATKWKSWGGAWGGDWQSPKDDLGHFEWHPDVTMRELCPSGAECPDPNEPWPEDRPLWVRPWFRAVGGLALAGGGLAVAYSLTKR